MTENDDDADTYPEGLRSYFPFPLRQPKSEPEISLRSRLASTWFAPMWLGAVVVVVGLSIGYVLPAIGMILTIAGISSIFIHWTIKNGRQFLGLGNDPEQKVLATCETVQKMTYQDLLAHRRATWPAPVIGICEAIMYPIAIQLGVPQFILAWIGLKTVGDWSWWKDQDASTRVSGRTRFYVFLLGNFFSIMVGFGTFLVLRHRLGPCWLEPLPRGK